MDGSDADTIEGPEAAFEVLSDETRLAIIRTLWAAEADGLPFSEIRQRLGNPDSGQFNYHLGQLTGHFVAKRDTGYVLTQAGLEVIRAVLAGTVTDRPVVEATPIDGTSCRACGAGLFARYEEHGIVECGSCGAMVMWNEFPPAGVTGRSPGEFARAFDRWTQSRFRLAMDGVCPSCGAPTTRPALTPDELEGAAPAVGYRCEHCKYEARVPVFAHVLTHPAVVSYFASHDIDITDQAYWDLQELRAGIDRELRDRDPIRVSLTLSEDDDHLTVVLDASLTVVEVHSPES